MESPQITRESPELKRESPELSRESPELKRESPEVIRQSPELKRESPELIRQSPELKRESPELSRESPSELKSESSEPLKSSLEVSHEEPRTVSKSSSESSSSEEACQIKQSSSEITEDTTDMSSSRPKDSSATESSVQPPDIRQDTLDEIDEDQSGAKQPTFQIQIATEQEVDDFYQVQPTTANEEAETSTEVKKSPTTEVKLESKTPPPSPAIEHGSYDMEGVDTSLVEAAAIASRELKEEEEKTETEIVLKPETTALSTQQPSAESEPSFIHSDDDASKEDDDKDGKIPSPKDDIPRRKQHDENSDSNEE